MKHLRLIMMGMMVLGLAACGETFTGEFKGAGQIQADSCNNSNVGPVNMTVVVTIDGNTIHFSLAELTEPNGTVLTTFALLASNGVNMGANLQGSTSFSVQNAAFPNVNFPNLVGSISISGSIDANRTKLTGFNVDAIPITNNGTPCNVKLIAVGPLNRQ